MLLQCHDNYMENSLKCTHDICERGPRRVSRTKPKFKKKKIEALISKKAHVRNFEKNVSSHEKKL